MSNHGDNPDRSTSSTSGWRGVLFFVPIVIWTFAGAAVIASLAMLSERFRTQGYTSWVKVWGRVPLALCGTRIEVHGAEYRDLAEPKLLLFNHVSLLDLFVMSALCPPRALVLYKQEFSRIPGLGLAFKALGMIPIDRTNHEAAIASIAEAGRRIRAEQATCVMAPEGTRSRRGGLQSFKLGAFHLAAKHSIPIIPMIMRGIESSLPMGSFIIRNGRVRVDYLPPIDTTEWQTETVRQHARDVRRIFLRYLSPEAGTEEDS